MTDTYHHFSDDFRKRFWAKVDVGSPDECWEWGKGRIPSRYGKVKHKGTTHLAHRVAYELSSGPIPPGLNVCHACDNRPCCNPAHLWVGTNADNARDRTEKGRNNSAFGDRNGSRTKPECMSRGERHISRMNEVAARGEDSGTSKLTTADVLAIRSATGFQREIAEQFGVSRENIGHILRRKTWKHIP